MFRARPFPLVFRARPCSLMGGAAPLLSRRCHVTPTSSGACGWRRRRAPNSTSGDRPCDPL
eukprot:5796655-Prymnesium_polylepis.1